MSTIYRPIPNFPDCYAGMDGAIVNGKTGNTLKPTPNVKTGYPCVTIRNANGIRKNRPVHLLVMSAFCGPCPAGLETLHANGNKMDPSLLNLSYGTRAQNMLDQVAHGTHHEATRTQCPQGHLYDKENTKLYEGRRYCRACHRADDRRRTAARREA